MTSEGHGECEVSAGPRPAGRYGQRVFPVFDGHNDALTRQDHAAIAAGRSGGHLDLPRMRPRLLAAFAEAGFTPDEITAIAWGSWRRVLATWWSPADGD